MNTGHHNAAAMSHRLACPSPTGALGHRLLAGRLDEHDLAQGETHIVKAMHAPEGDFRNWKRIRTWADEIAARPR